MARKTQKLLYVILSLFSLTTVFTAIAATNQRPNQPDCCCPHIRQIADDLHHLRTMMDKPYKGHGVKEMKFGEFKLDPVKPKSPDFKPGKFPQPPKKR